MIVGEHIVRLGEGKLEIMQIEGTSIESRQILTVLTLENIRHMAICGFKNKFIFCTGGFQFYTLFPVSNVLKIDLISG